MFGFKSKLEKRIEALEQYSDNLEREKYEKVLKYVKNNIGKTKQDTRRDILFGKYSTYSIGEASITNEVTNFCCYTGIKIVEFKNIKLNPNYSRKLYHYVDTYYKQYKV